MDDLGDDHPAAADEKGEIRDVCAVAGAVLEAGAAEARWNHEETKVPQRP